MSLKTTYSPCLVERK